MSEPVSIFPLHLCVQFRDGVASHAGLFWWAPNPEQIAAGWRQLARCVGSTIPEALGRIVARLAREREHDSEIRAAVEVLPPVLRDLVGMHAAAAEVLEAMPDVPHLEVPDRASIVEQAPVPGWIEANLGGEVRRVRVRRSGPTTAESVGPEVLVHRLDGREVPDHAEFDAKRDEMGRWTWTLRRVVFEPQIGRLVAGWLPRGATLGSVPAQQIEGREVA